MLTFAKIGLVGLVLLSSKMADAETSCPAGAFFDEKTSGCLPCVPGEYKSEEGESMCLKCPDNKLTIQGAKSVEDCKDQWRGDYKCGVNDLNSLGQRAKCNPNWFHFCNDDGWCERKKDDDYDDTDDKAKKEKKDKDQTDSDDDVTNSPSATSGADCKDKICIDFTSTHRHHHAFYTMKEVYNWNTHFVKDKEVKDGRNLYASIDKYGKKEKYAMWWTDGYWMVGEYEKRKTWSAFAYAKSEEKCPEEIAYDWKYFDGSAWRSADQAMSVYDVCKYSKKD